MIQVAGQPAFVKDVPAWGWKVVRPEMLKDSGEAPKATPTHMENRFYSIELDETGCLTGIYDKINRRQVHTGRANVLEAFDDHPRNCDNWEITPERVALAKKHALIMHPGPMNRGVEIASSAADSAQSVITQQVESGVAVRMALLYMITRREG